VSVALLREPVSGCGPKQLSQLLSL